MIICMWNEGGLFTSASSLFVLPFLQERTNFLDLDLDLDLESRSGYLGYFGFSFVFSL